MECFDRCLMSSELYVRNSFIVFDTNYWCELETWRSQIQFNLETRSKIIIIQIYIYLFMTRTILQTLSHAG